MDYNLSNRKIFDTHTKIGKFGSWVMKNNRIEPFSGREITNTNDINNHMKKFRIEKAIVVPHYTPNQNLPFEVYNPLVLDASSKLENVYGALWVSPLLENSKKTIEVLDSLPIKKIVALKMSPDSWPEGKYTPNPETWDEEFRDNIELIMKAAKKHDLMIHMHTGTENSNIMEYVNFVSEFGKKIKIQFNHMGSSAGGHFAFTPRFIDWLKDKNKVYCDTSFCRGFGPAWLVKEMQENYPKGLDNIFFASDYPWTIFESEFWKVEGIPCTDKIKNKIFYENAIKAYLK
ncbi:MAG: amidohydrolase family protein [Candidatus Nanoarchaeia archaeon]|nr:amidohydrolase family protein [Candidatus Nanoarchaeia archaeon]